MKMLKITTIYKQNNSPDNIVEEIPVTIVIPCPWNESIIPEMVEHLCYSFYYTLCEEKSYFLKSFSDVLNEEKPQTDEEYEETEALMDMIILKSIISSKYEIFESTKNKEKTITYALLETKSDFVSKERWEKLFNK